MNNLRYLILSLILNWIGSPFAGTLTGKFTFTEIPASVALVYFADDHSSSKSSAIEVDEKDKKFMRKLVVGSNGTEITFKNSDNLEHNIYANDLKTKVNFDVGLIAPGNDSKVVMNWKEGEIIRVGCKIHPKMEAYIANISSTHYAIVEFTSTDKNQAFKIDNVPDNISHVRVWFPKHDPIESIAIKGTKQQVDIIKNIKVVGSLSLSRD